MRVWFLTWIVPLWRLARTLWIDWLDYQYQQCGKVLWPYFHTVPKYNDVEYLYVSFNIRLLYLLWGILQLGLSEHSGIGPSMGNPISLLKDLSHAACHPVLASSMYSASPTDNATVFCCWDAQDIAPLAIRKTCPDVEWQSSLFLPQSDSEYLINPASEFPSYLGIEVHILHTWYVPLLGYC